MTACEAQLCRALHFTTDIFSPLGGGEKIKKHLSNRQVQNRNILLIRAEASGAVRIQLPRLEIVSCEIMGGFESHVAGSLTHMCAAAIGVRHISNKSVNRITLLLEIAWSNRKVCFIYFPHAHRTSGKYLIDIWAFSQYPIFRKLPLEFDSCGELVNI